MFTSRARVPPPADGTHLLGSPCVLVEILPSPQSAAFVAPPDPWPDESERVFVGLEPEGTTGDEVDDTDARRAEGS